MIFFLLLSCHHQYLAIPGAEVIEGTFQYAYPNALSTSSTPTYTVTADSPDLAVGESTTVQIDFSAVTEFEVTEIVFLGLQYSGSDFGDTWIWPLTDEEMTTKTTDIDIYALDEQPKK